MKFWLWDCHLEFWQNISQTFPMLHTFAKLNQEEIKGRAILSPPNTCSPPSCLCTLGSGLFPESSSFTPWLGQHFPPNPHNPHPRIYQVHPDGLCSLYPSPFGLQNLHLWVPGSRQAALSYWLIMGSINALTYWLTEWKVNEKQFLGNHKWFLGLTAFKWCN